MPAVIVKWRNSHDDRVCPICKDLEDSDYTWTFEGEVPDSLMHPVHGEVWNVTIGSLAHEAQQFGKKYGLLSTCRCHLETKVEANDLIHLLQQKIDELKNEIVEAPDYQSGGKRTTTFDDLGIDPSKYGLE